MSELKKVKVISWGRNGNIRTDSNLDAIRTKSLFYRLQWYRVRMIGSDLLTLSYCRTLLLTKIFESLWQNSDLSGIGWWCGQKMVEPVTNIKNVPPLKVSVTHIRHQYQWSPYFSGLSIRSRTWPFHHRLSRFRKSKSCLPIPRWSLTDPVITGRGGVVTKRTRDNFWLFLRQ